MTLIQRETVDLQGFFARGYLTLWTQLDISAVMGGYIKVHEVGL